MKRILCGAMLVLLCALLLTAAAEMPELKTTVIEPYGFPIPMPADYCVLVHNMDADDPSLAMFDLDPAFADDLLTQGAYDVMAISADLTREIDVRVTEGGAATYGITEETMEEFGKSIYDAGDAANGNTYDGYSVEQAGAHTVFLIKAHVTENPDMCVYRLLAVYGDDLVMMQNTSMDGVLTDDDRALILAIAAGAGDDAAAPAEETSVLGGIFSNIAPAATDESRIAFDPGAKWTLDPSSEESNRGYLYSDDPLVAVNFVYYDMWGDPDFNAGLQQMGFAGRTDITLDALGEDLIAMLLGTDAGKVNYRSFGTTSFACTDSPLEGKMSEESQQLGTYSALCTDNGYIYVFSYVTADGNFDGMNDYEELLSTVTFR